MNTTITVLTLAIAVLVFLRERPRRKETRQVWALYALSGVFSFLVPGDAFALQMV